MFGVEFQGLLAQLEVEHTVAAAVVLDSAEDVACVDFLSFAYDD